MISSGEKKGCYSPRSPRNPGGSTAHGTFARGMVNSLLNRNDTLRIVYIRGRCPHYFYSLLNRNDTLRIVYIRGRCPHYFYSLLNRNDTLRIVYIRGRCPHYFYYIRGRCPHYFYFMRHAVCAC